MEIRLYNTQEIPEGLWDSIISGYNSCFPTHQKTKKDLWEKYTTNTFGTSYHAICLEGEQVIGFIEATPYNYQYDGELVLMALTGDIFIIKDHRQDLMLFAKLYQAIKKYCAEKGVVCFFGVANENAYLYSVKVLRCKVVQTMDYWILPVRISNILQKSWLKPFDCLSWLYAELSLTINSFFVSIFNGKQKNYKCKLVDDEVFRKARLDSEKYHNITKGRYSFTYTITNDEGVKCAYIMRFDESGKRTNKALCKCVGYILRHEHVDMVMFNGTLGLNTGLLIKTPKKLEPRTLHVTVNYMDKECQKKYSGILDNNGLDFTLLNLDVR